MRERLWAVTLLWVYTIGVHAQSNQRGSLFVEPYAEIVQQARVEILGLQHTQALQTLQRLPATPTGQALEAFHAALSALVQAYATDERAHLQRFYAQEQRFLAVHPRLPAGYLADFLDAEMAYYTSLALAREQRMTRAAVASRTAYRKLREVQSRYPAEVDVLKSLGVMHMTLASVPAPHRALLSTVGMRGTTSQGFAELTRAAREGRAVREEATFMLALFDVVSRARYDEATRHIPRLPAPFRLTALAQHIHGFTLLSAGRAADAEAAFRRALSPAPGKDLLAYSVYFHADALLHLGRHTESRQQFDRFLALQPNRGLRLPALLRAGYAAAFAGEPSAALRYFNRVLQDGRPQSESDDEALREARTLVAQGGLRGASLTLLQAQYALNTGHAERASNLLSRDEDGGPWLVLLRSRILLLQNNVAESIDSFRQLTNAPRGQVSARFRAEALFYVAQALRAQGNTRDARSALDALLRIDEDFPGKPTLRLRARAALEAL